MHRLILRPRSHARTLAGLALLAGFVLLTGPASQIARGQAPVPIPGQPTGPGAGFVPGSGAGAAPAAVVPPTPLPPPVRPLTDAVKKATAPLSAAQMTEVTAYVNGNVANLAAAGPGGAPVNPMAVSLAIKGLADGSTSGTPFFSAAYSQALSAAVPKALATADARTRVSVGVAVSRVAALSPNEKLAPAIMALLADKSAPVAALGVKSARTVYPLLNTVPKQADAMAQQIILLMRAHGMSSDSVSESIAEDAFEALAGDAVAAQILAGRFPGAADSMLLLMHTRAALWGSGTSVAGDTTTHPPQPNLESKPILFLSTRGWRALSPAQKASAGRALFDLATETNRLAPLAPAAPSQPPPPGVWQKDLYDLQKQALSGIEAAASIPPAALPVVAEAKASSALTGTPANSVVLASQLTTLGAAMTAANIMGTPPPPPVAPVTLPTTRPATGTNPPAGPKTGTPAPLPGGGAALNK